MIFYEIQNLYQEHISSEELKKKLDDAQIEFYAFILHDKDKKSDGNIKKPHYHCIIGIEVDNKKAKATAEAFAQTLYGRGIVKNVRNLQKALSYLIHKFDPNKFQYEYDEIITNDNDIVNENVKEFTPKVSDSDMLVEEFYNYCVKEYFDIDYIDMFNFFKEHKKLDYFIQHQGKLQAMVINLKTNAGLVMFCEDDIETIQRQVVEKKIDDEIKQLTNECNSLMKEVH